MRKIEKLMVYAIRFNKEFRSGNTQVIKRTDRNGEDYLAVKLYNTVIARVYDSYIVPTDHDYKTNTTKSRLNAVLSLTDVHVFQKNFDWYFSNGMKYDEVESIKRVA